MAKFLVIMIAMFAPLVLSGTASAQASCGPECYGADAYKRAFERDYRQRVEVNNRALGIKPSTKTIEQQHIQGNLELTCRVYKSNTPECQHYLANNPAPVR